METNNIYGKYRTVDIIREIIILDKKTVDEISERIDKELTVNKNPDILRKAKDFLKPGTMRNELHDDIKYWFLTKCLNLIKTGIDGAIDSLFENYSIVYQKSNDPDLDLVLVKRDIPHYQS